MEKMTQQITRHVEICRNCGSWNSFRILRTMTAHGQKRAYAKCRVCGQKAVISYRQNAKVSIT
jgi:transcription elongation factor Elf1